MAAVLFHEDIMNTLLMVNPNELARIITVIFKMKTDENYKIEKVDGLLLAVINSVNMADKRYNEKKKRTNEYYKNKKEKKEETKKTEKIETEKEKNDRLIKEAEDLVNSQIAENIRELKTKAGIIK